MEEHIQRLPLASIYVKTWVCAPHVHINKSLRSWWSWQVVHSEKHGSPELFQG